SLRDDGAEGLVDAADPPLADVAAPPPASNGSAAAGLDVAIVRHRWTELKEAVAGQLPRAAIALEAASVAGVRDGELLLAFTNDFLQRTIEAAREGRPAPPALPPPPPPLPPPPPPPPP